MFLYIPGGRNALGVSDSQMQSELADSLIMVNEAMVNSEIDLRFSLVRIEPLPYEEESTASSVVLNNLKENEEIAELRDFYGADLVHLVADLALYTSPVSATYMRLVTTWGATTTGKTPIPHTHMPTGIDTAMAPYRKWYAHFNLPASMCQ
ncbi:unnamed protein product, partial [Ascophyllum nodosum]